MPRAKTASAARCVKHGVDCAIGGGSRYRSSYCARVESSRWSVAPSVVSDEPDAELLAAIAEQRSAEDGIPLADVLATQTRELAEGDARWRALSPAQRCASRDGEDAELVAILADARAEALAAR